MSSVWKIVGSILAVAVIGAFGFCTVWTVRNWNTVYNSLNGSSVYSYQDIEKAKKDTYDEAAKNEKEYQKTIADLRDLVTNLQVDKAALNDELAALNLSASSNESEIRQLTIRKANLESQVADLQENKSANEALIVELNTRIINLNNRITEISEMSQNAVNRITALTNRCNELQASINKYESFINTQESNEQAVATYEVDGAVWKIEIVNKGEITLPQVTNTDTIIFNGWTVNDVLLGNTYTINSNTKFIASVVHKYAVQFMTDDVVYNSQYVVENENATVPTAPTKNGYDFIGWSLNGVDIINDINTIKVTENVTYHAVFVKIHTVTFMNGEQIIATQNVRNGDYADDNNIVVETSGIFQGWKIDGTIVDVSTYKILNNTVFIAVIENNTWEPVTWNGFTSIQGSQIWRDNNSNIYYSNGNTQYKLNEATNTWEEMTWNGIASFEGLFIWKDNNNNIYYSRESQQYKLNEATNTWEEMTWNGFSSIAGNYLWKDNNNNFYCPGLNSNKYYKLNETTNTWEQITWIGCNPSSQGIWKDNNNNIYYSYTSKQYKLNETTDTWEKVTWNGFSSIIGSHVWKDNNNNIYYSYDSKQYKLNEATNTWEEMTWNGLVSFSGTNIWADNNNNIYYSTRNGQFQKSVG